MERVVEEFVTIGDLWRLVAFGIECVLCASLTESEVARVLQDAAADQVSAKDYEFRREGRAAILGVVDAYEPETLRVVVSGYRILMQALPDIVDRARALANSLRGA
jgi:hypothetical protein